MEFRAVRLVEDVDHVSTSVGVVPGDEMVLTDEVSLGHVDLAPFPAKGPPTIFEKQLMGIYCKEPLEE